MNHIDPKAPKKRYRILFCSDALLVDGVTSYILHLGTALVREGHQVAVLGRWAGKGFQDRYREEGMQVFCCPSPGVGNFWFDAKAKAFDPHVILTDSRRSFPLAVRLKKITGKPVVTYFLDHLEKTDRPGRDVLSLTEWSDLWAVAEDPIRRSLIEAAPEMPIFKLPRPLEGIIQGAPPPEKDPFHLVCFGRLSGYKTPGMFRLLQEVDWLDQEIPGFCITVVGGGGWRLWRFKALAAKINRKLGRSCVRVTGTQIDPAPWLEKASVICGGSTSAIEGVLSERPVICFTGFWFGLITEENLEEALGYYFGERGGHGHFHEPGVLEKVVPEVLRVYREYGSLRKDLPVMAQRLQPHFSSGEAVSCFQNIMDFLKS